MVSWFPLRTIALKGTRAFLRDKFKRLGLPYLTFFLILGPALAFIVQAVTDKPFAYSPGPGQCWFLGWPPLLIFCIAYVNAPGDASGQRQPEQSNPRALPGLGALIGCGAAAGLLCAILIVAGVPGFVFMPISIGSFPMDVLFFVAGITAKRMAGIRH